MNFFSKVDLPVTDLKINYNSRLAFFGSCFADNISAQFTARKFNVLANPFGTVYNPVSLESQIKAITDGKVFGEDDVFQDTRCDGLWHCWDAHSSLSGATKEECIGKLNAATTQARDFLQKADAVFITLGTAFVYYLKDSGKPVSNCHRQDPNLFTRRMISVDEATEAIREIVENLRRITATTENTNSHEPRIVFTVSPIRHKGDGAHGNNLSKATVLLGIEKAIAEIAASPSAPRNDAVTYFPSYEIVMDELRDYRFYADDMIHLSKTAEEYIFEQMTETYCDSTTREIMAKVEKFMKMANHRIQDESSPATQQLKKKIAVQAAELEKQIPGLSLR
ncbi:GSCFA family protein [Fibrobacter sp. UWB15]|uniref:GSCFA domain-containing protein n=1 Tax=unclassified Fibrobacter TaxID=2634177 RepID=UPI00091E302D|nr:MULTISPECIES: GSCFA domain-containing protein [unclassified Fibrobacter]PWJ63814.1 GSCFA family protein [Fibrobacter sp. UWB6]SHG26801.1 GSCFA family protein [Fibrobacter sp. UWB8]SMG34417.1 GSCFA family protein [Fibrobacter sp. UWB15]